LLCDHPLRSHERAAQQPELRSLAALASKQQLTQSRCAYGRAGARAGCRAPQRRRAPQWQTAWTARVRLRPPAGPSPTAPAAPAPGDADQLTRHARAALRLAHTYSFWHTCAREVSASVTSYQVTRKMKRGTTVWIVHTAHHLRTSRAGRTPPCVQAGSPVGGRGAHGQGARDGPRGPGAPRGVGQLAAQQRLGGRDRRQAQPRALQPVLQARQARLRGARGQVSAWGRASGSQLCVGVRKEPQSSRPPRHAYPRSGPTGSCVPKEHRRLCLLSTKCSYWEQVSQGKLHAFRYQLRGTSCTQKRSLRTAIGLCFSTTCLTQRPPVCNPSPACSSCAPQWHPPGLAAQ